VQREGASRAAKTYTTRPPAINYARAVELNNKHRQVTVHVCFCQKGDRRHNTPCERPRPKGRPRSAPKDTLGQLEHAFETI
jgi:hypothetical protein